MSETETGEEADPETLAAAAITAAIVGFKIGGPFGALAGATFANHYGKFYNFNLFCFIFFYLAKSEKNIIIL